MSRSSTIKFPNSDVCVVIRSLVGLTMCVANCIWFVFRDNFEYKIHPMGLGPAGWLALEWIIGSPYAILAILPPCENCVGQRDQRCYILSGPCVTAPIIPIFFGLAVFIMHIIGAIVLFGSNMEPLENGSPLVIYSVVIWVFIIVWTLCPCGSKCTIKKCFDGTPEEQCSINNDQPPSYSDAV